MISSRDGAAGAPSQTGPDMENRAYALATGVFIIVLAAALAFLGFWLSGGHQPQKPYIVVSENSVGGLTVHSTVVYRGVAVGEVSAIEFDPQDFNKIFVHVLIDSDIPVTQNTYAQLKPQGVTGLSRIALNSSGKNGKVLTTSAAHPAHIPMKPSLLERFTTAGQQLVQEGNRLIANLNDLLGSSNRGRVSKLLDHLDKSVQTLTQLEKEMAPAVKTMPRLTRDSQRMIKRTDKLVARLDALTRQASGAITQARQVSSQGQTAMKQLNGETLPRLNHLLDELTSATGAARQLAQQLQNNPQGLIVGGGHPPPGPGEPGFQGGQ